MSVRFVTDSEIGNEIIDLINKAEQKIILVSPYNNEWKEERPDMVKALRKAQRNPRITIIAYYNDCKETKKNQYPTSLLPNIRGISVRSLHAKIYANESTVLITSHNLTKGSLHNREVGLVIQDATLYREIKNYVETLTEVDETEREIDEDLDEFDWEEEEPIGKIHVLESEWNYDDGLRRKTYSSCGRRVRRGWEVIRDGQKWRKMLDDKNLRPRLCKICVGPIQSGQCVKSD